MAVIADLAAANASALGYMVHIKHPAALLGKASYSLYLHLQGPPRVRVGETVVGGKTMIGKVGKTGKVLGGCHTHFEIRFFPERFYKRWNNIYGEGRQAGLSDWANPLVVFAKFPKGARVQVSRQKRIPGGALLVYRIDNLNIRSGSIAPERRRKIVRGIAQNMLARAKYVNAPVPLIQRVGRSRIFVQLSRAHQIGHLRRLLLNAGRLPGLARRGRSFVITKVEERTVGPLDNNQAVRLGGLIFEVQFDRPVDPAQLQSRLASQELENVAVQQFGGRSGVLIRLTEPIGSKAARRRVINRLRSFLARNKPRAKIRRAEIVGPNLSHYELIKVATLGLAHAANNELNLRDFRMSASFRQNSEVARRFAKTPARIHRQDNFRQRLLRGGFPPHTNALSR